MEFERKFSIGDIVAIMVAVLAVVGLLLQAKSTAISEEQLRSQVQDISEVVSQLEAQQEQLIDEQIDRLNQGEELYNSQSAMHKQLLDIGRLDRRITNMFFRSILLSQSSVQLALSTEEFDHNILDILADGRNINVQLMKVIEFTSVWQKEIQKISDDYDVKMAEVRSTDPISHETLKSLEKLNDEMALDIAETNGRYTEKYEVIREEFIASQEALLSRVTGVLSK